MTEKEWEKVHLGSTVEYSAFNLLSFLTGGLIYGGCMNPVEQKSQEYVLTKRYIANYTVRNHQDGTILTDSS